MCLLFLAQTKWVIYSLACISIPVLGSNPTANFLHWTQRLTLFQPKYAEHASYYSFDHYVGYPKKNIMVGLSWFDRLRFCSDSSGWRYSRGYLSIIRYIRLSKAIFQMYRLVSKGLPVILWNTKVEIQYLALHWQT